MFADVIGHKEPLRLLRQAIFSERLPNAYLFVGPANCGKTFTALQFAKALNCERAFEFASPEAVDCCESCSNCLHFHRQSHPDLMIVHPLLSLTGEDELYEPVEEENAGESGLEFVEIEGAIIRVSQIEALIAHNALKRVQARRKIYILISAETMNPEAANRLLKTLEEPSPHTIFILTAATTQSLLPTIISRCQLIHFNPVPVREATERLAQQYPHILPERIQSLVALSAGRVGWAIRMLEHPEMMQIRQDLLDLCVALPGKPMLECLKGGEQLLSIAERLWLATVEAEIAEKALKARRDRILRTCLRDVLDILISWFRDLIVVAADPDSPYIINSDRREDLQRLAPLYQIEACRRVCTYLEDMKMHLRQNANLRLAAEIMALRMISASPRAA